MVDEGWRPKRNIYIASWDGEEWSLIGSTHFVERFEDFVDTQLVAYINLDTAVSGHNLKCGSSGLLSKRVIDKMKELNHPYEPDVNNGTLFEKWYERNGFNDDNEAQPYPLGDGSDFVAFVNYLNIPSVDVGFNGLFGTYHSVYDSYYWMTQHIDPNYQYHRVMSQWTGLIAMEFLDNDLLPYNMTNLGIVMNQWLNINVPQTERLYNCFLDASNVNLLQSVINEYMEFAMEFDEITLQLAQQSNVDKEEIIFWNHAMKELPKQFLFEQGLTGRLYFKNILVAPDQDSGYDSQVFPLIAHAIKYTNCDSNLIDQSVQTTYDILMNANNYLESYIQLNNTSF